MFLSVSSCACTCNGMNREYMLSDGSIVTENLYLPTFSRFRYFDCHSQRVYKKSEQAAMKSAVERHRKQWKIS
ncbi:hypothetical protein [Rahnella sp. ChDrAdgB13]|uniref:hypothetical protein n=1 Tax=Rahnella sp. ChDrAdgB13 TaxID=1850581 RepID=UPI001AD8519B|nr:hypothetical protein [Rahnella sp. ChDrAdgB13]